MGNARDVGFSLTVPNHWTGRTAQVEGTINTVHEGCWPIVNAVVERRTKARGPGHHQGMTKATQTPTAPYNIEEWMQGLKEEAAKEEARHGDAGNCRLVQRNTHS